MIAHSPWRSTDPAASNVSVPSYLEQAALRFKDSTALVTQEDDAYTYWQVWEAGLSLGRFLQDQGIQPGERIAILSGNLPEYFVVFQGILHAGAVPTTLNPLYKEEELVHQMEDSGAVAVFTMKLFEGNITGIRDRLPALRKVWAIEDAFRMAEEAPPEPVPNPDLDPAADLACLPYSSGTTGLPKGVMISHANFVANIRQMVATGLVTERSVLLDFLPFFHAYGLTVLMNGGFATGASQVLMLRFDAEQCLELIERHGVTSLTVVPPALNALVNAPNARTVRAPALEYILSGAAPLPLEVAEEASRILGSPVIQGYGMTETTAAANVDRPEQARPKAVGLPLADTEEKVVSLEDDRELGVDEEGELLIRGPQVMLGYWNRPDATAETITEDGWLRTGDIARIGSDGYVYVIDRKKELIKCKGFQVAPAELEALLMEHETVLDVAVIPKPDARSGEVPKAFIVPRPGTTQDEAGLFAFVEERVAPHKRLREIEFVDAIPKAISGKILRRELVKREQAKANP